MRSGRRQLGIPPNIIRSLGDAGYLLRFNDLQPREIGRLKMRGRRPVSGKPIQTATSKHGAVSRVLVCSSRI